MKTVLLCLVLMLLSCSDNFFDDDGNQMQNHYDTTFVNGDTIITKNKTITVTEVEETTNPIYQYEVINSNSDFGFYEFDFLDSLHGVAISFNDEIITTVDGGLNWIKRDSIGELTNIFVSYVNDSSIYLSGKKINDSDELYIYRSIDSGKTFTKKKVDGSLHELTSICFVDSVGYAAGLGGILKTENNGESWVLLADIPGWKSNIYFLDEQSGYCSILGLLNKTDDGGKNWKSIGLEKRARVSQYLDDYLLFAISDEALLLSKDEGVSWSKILIRVGYGQSFSHFSDKYNGIIIRQVTQSYDNNVALGKKSVEAIWYNTIYQTTDGGKTWSEDFDTPLSSVTKFYNNTSGYCLSRLGFCKIVLRNSVL